MMYLRNRKQLPNPRYSWTVGSTGNAKTGEARPIHSTGSSDNSNMETRPMSSFDSSNSTLREGEVLGNYSGTHAHSSSNKTGGTSPIPVKAPLQTEQLTDLTNRSTSMISRESIPVQSSKSDGILLEPSRPDQESDEIAKLKARIQELETEKQSQRAASESISRNENSQGYQISSPQNSLNKPDHSLSSQHQDNISPQYPPQQRQHQDSNYPLYSRQQDNTQYPDMTHQDNDYPHTVDHGQNNYPVIYQDNNHRQEIRQDIEYPKLSSDPRDRYPVKMHHYQDNNNPRDGIQYKGNSYPSTSRSYPDDVYPPVSRPQQENSYPLTQNHQDPSNLRCNEDTVYPPERRYQQDDRNMTVPGRYPDNGYPQLNRDYPRQYASKSEGFQGSNHGYYQDNSYPQNTRSTTDGYPNQYQSESRSYPVNNAIERRHNLDHEPTKIGGYQGPYPKRTPSGNQSGTGTPEPIVYQQPRTASSISQDTYKSRLPYYNGKGDWKSFMVQFEIIAERNDWGPRQKANEIMLVLKDEALQFATRLAPEVRTSFSLLNAEMNRRFGDTNYPETYRRELQLVKKQYKESIYEYASRVENMVRKAYPGLERSLFNNLSIEHMLSGLPDQSIMYDVLTKRPTTMDEAINLVTWHMTFKNGIKSKSGSNIRSIEIENGNEDYECRKVGRSFVTEERLHQFGRDIKDSMTKEIVSSVGDIIDKKLSIKTDKPRQPLTPEKNVRPWNHEKPQQQRKRLCYTCNGEGHFSRDCPKNMKNEDTNQKKHQSKTRSLN